MFLDFSISIFIFQVFQSLWESWKGGGGRVKLPWMMDLSRDVSQTSLIRPSDAPCHSRRDDSVLPTSYYSRTTSWRGECRYIEWLPASAKHLLNALKPPIIAQPGDNPKPHETSQFIKTLPAQHPQSSAKLTFSS